MLLPFTNAVVPTVDLAGGRVVIELPQEIEGDDARRSRDGFDMTWRATVLTLFPEMFPGPLGVSLAGKALASGLWGLEARDIRHPRPTATAASMTRRPAAGPAWCCGPTCWRRRSMPRMPARAGRVS